MSALIEYSPHFQKCAITGGFGSKPNRPEEEAGWRQGGVFNQTTMANSAWKPKFSVSRHTFPYELPTPTTPPRTPAKEVTSSLVTTPMAS